MSYYDYDESDFYHEPSEFEQKVDELKESLLESVKKDFIDEMNRLRKENEELQEVKNNMKNLEFEHAEKLNELNRERRDLERKVRSERLSSLIGAVEYFTVASRGKDKPKCEKCDENRRLNYKTPSGRKDYEMCECSERVPVYQPIPTTMCEFSIRSGTAYVWYQVKDHGRDDEYLKYYDDSISGTELITDEKQFGDIKYSYRTLFKTEEIAQKYCDLQNKEKIHE